MNPSKFVDPRGLREGYGLTLAWINRLGAPERLIQRPLGKAPIPLYARRRLEATLDQNPEAYLRMVLQQASQRASQRSAEMITRQQAELATWAKTVPLDLKQPLPLTLDQLRHATKLSLQNHLALCPTQVGYNAVIAYLRHTATAYNQIIATLGRRLETTTAYLIIKGRVNRMLQQELTRHYPAHDLQLWLAPEASAYD